MKRILALVLAMVMLMTFIVSMTSCDLLGGKGNGTAADFVMPEGGFDATTPVTIKFYHSMGANLQAILNQAIADFNEIYPNITIEHESYGDYNGVRDQIKTEISVGNQPNIAYCYPDHVALYNVAGAVQTLDVLIDDPTIGFTQAQKDDFIQGYYQEGMAFGDGKMYTLPLSKSTEVLYYNKTFFEQNKLKVPTTWDEMEAVCEQIKALEPTSNPLGYDSESNWFITMCEQYGSPYTSATGENFLFDNATNKDFVKRFRSWHQKKWVTTEELYGGYTSALFTGESSSTETNEPTGTRCYMCIGSTGGATYQQPSQTNGVYEFEVGIAPIPQVNASSPKAISQGPSLCIFDSDDKQEVVASWLFVKFLTTDAEFQASFSKVSGYIPVIERDVLVQTASWYGEWLASGDPIATAIDVALSQKDAYFVSPAFNGSSKARDQVGELMKTCFTTQATDIDAMIKQKFEEAIAECIADA